MKLKNAGRAVLSLACVFMLNESTMPAGMDSAESTNDGEDQEDEDEKAAREAENADFLDEFMLHEEVTGMEDHPDLDLNPVILFQIKKAKEAQKLLMQRAQLAAEGFSEAEIDERMEMNQAGGGAGDGKANALAVLIAAGARVEPAAGGTNDQEKLKKTELRRKQKTINVYLSKTLDIDTKLEPESTKAVRNKKTALDVANSTKLKPVGGESYQREIRAMQFAKHSRLVFRDHKKALDAQEAKKQTKISTGGGGEGERRGGGLLDAADFAALADELDEDDEEEGDGDEEELDL